MSGRPKATPPRRRTHPVAAGNVAEAHTTVTEVARSGRAGTNNNEFRSDFPRGAHFVDRGDGFSQRAADAYRRIRQSPEDTAAVAANTGIDAGVVERMRQNLFVQEHDIAVGPNQIERGYFTPDDDIVDLWDGAARGTLDAERAAEFRNLAAHEYVENKLMEAGLPYRSSHPDAFNADGDHILHRDHPGAHDLAPNEWRPEAPLQHWRLFGIDSSGLRLAPDLSNLDEIALAALRGLKQ